MNKFVEVNPRVCNGKPVVAGTRITVTAVLDQLAEADTLEDVLKEFPELTREQLAGVLRYCHSVVDHTEIEAEVA